jgi:inner membrane protein
MDPISQGVLGAACSQSVTPSKRIVPATIAGVVSGMAADVDVVISSRTDPLLFLEFHRHFTHSLVFIPFGALICAAALHWFLRDRLRFRETFLACLVGYASHGLLDACTTYGTLLLWPFSNVRVAWNNVSVVDPLFTIPVGALVLLAVKRRRAVLGAAALAWAVFYLSVGYFQMLRAVDAGAQLAASRNHVPERARAMPSIANLWLWRHVYEYDGRLYVDAIRVFASTTYFEGSSLREPDVHRDFPWLQPDSTQAIDLARFSHFADGFLGIAESAPTRIVDVRYSALPNDVTGVWAIKLDPAAPPDQHVDFVTDRVTEPGQAQQLLRMLFL